MAFFAAEQGLSRADRDASPERGSVRQRQFLLWARRHLLFGVVGVFSPQCQLGSGWVYGLALFMLTVWIESATANVPKAYTTRASLVAEGGWLILFTLFCVSVNSRPLWPLFLFTVVDLFLSGPLTGGISINNRLSYTTTSKMRPWWLFFHLSLWMAMLVWTFLQWRS
jgi:hypothetical protein